MLSRTRLLPFGFIEPCLPSPVEHPPSGPGWIHEIKHDGFRLMARRDARGVRLLTRNGIDWSGRFPLIAAAAGGLQVRSCLIDGKLGFGQSPAAGDRPSVAGLISKPSVAENVAPHRPERKPKRCQRPTLN